MCSWVSPCGSISYSFICSVWIKTSSLVLELVQGGDSSSGRHKSLLCLLANMKWISSYVNRKYHQKINSNVKARGALSDHSSVLHLWEKISSRISSYIDKMTAQTEYQHLDDAVYGDLTRLDPANLQQQCWDKWSKVWAVGWSESNAPELGQMNYMSSLWHQKGNIIRSVTHLEGKNCFRFVFHLWTFFYPLIFWWIQTFTVMGR